MQKLVGLAGMLSSSLKVKDILQQIFFFVLIIPRPVGPAEIHQKLKDACHSLCWDGGRQILQISMPAFYKGATAMWTIPFRGSELQASPVEAKGRQRQ